MFDLIWNRDLIYDAGHPDVCKIDICAPAGVERPPVYVFFHGGGLIEGTREIGPELRWLAAKRGIAVASVGYRLIPGARFPEFVEDAARACAWLCKEWNLREKHRAVYIGGSSAGAYLAMMLFFDRHFLLNAGADERFMDGCIFNAGQPMTHYNVLGARGEDPRRVVIDEAAPLYHIRESFAGKRAAPLLIAAADRDMPNRLEQNQVLRAALLHFDYPEDQVEMRVMRGFGHCGYDAAQDAAGRYLFSDIIADFIHRHSPRGGE